MNTRPKNVETLRESYNLIDGEKGITLIALMVTIIVLLVLATVSINLILRENLIGKAQYATNEYEKGTQKEAESLNTFESEIDKIMNEIREDDSLGQHYLNLINIVYGLVDASEEEKTAAENEFGELKGLLLGNETEICMNINKYYYYSRTDNPLVVLLDEDSNEYKKFNNMVKELLDLEERLNDLLSESYTFTEENWSKEEFKTYIETNLDTTVQEVYDKDMLISIYFKSSIDEKCELWFDIITSKQGSTYTIEKIEYINFSMGS